MASIYIRSPTFPFFTLNHIIAYDVCVLKRTNPTSHLSTAWPKCTSLLRSTEALTFLDYEQLYIRYLSEGGSARCSSGPDMTKESLLNSLDCHIGYQASDREVRAKILSTRSTYPWEFMLTVTLYLTACDDLISNVWALLDTRAQEKILLTPNSLSSMVSSLKNWHTLIAAAMLMEPPM